MDKLFNETDWVSGKTSGGAMFMGFVETIRQNGLDVYITNSDDEKLIGLTSRFAWWQIKKSEENILDEGSIMNLIDIALDERNEEAFAELTQRLQMVKNKAVPV